MFYSFLAFEALLVCSRCCDLCFNYCMYSDRYLIMPGSGGWGGFFNESPGTTSDMSRSNGNLFRAISERRWQRREVNEGKESSYGNIFGKQEGLSLFPVSVQTAGFSDSLGDGGDVVKEINVSAHRRRFLLSARCYPATGSSVCAGGKGS